MAEKESLAGSTRTLPDLRHTSWFLCQCLFSIRASTYHHFFIHPVTSVFMRDL